MMAESQEAASILSIFNRGNEHFFSKEAGPGRQFLNFLKGTGDVVSLEKQRKAMDRAQTLADAPSLNQGVKALRTAGEYTNELERILNRVSSCYTFRQVAMSGLKVKRAGWSQATRDNLRNSYDFHPQIETKEDGRKYLELTRFSDTGDELALQWILRQ